MAEDLEIRLLGGIEVLRSGQLLALPASKKTRALLGYLAVTGRSQTREHLCELLWPGPDDPRAALRWSLAKLRALLGSQALATDRERVALGSVATDLARARALLAQGSQAEHTSLIAVAKSFRGELLEGLSMPDVYRYHQWWLTEAEAVRALRAEVLRALVQRYAGEPATALAWARQLVVLDPLSESAHAGVIRLLGALGRRREALAQYEECARILERELGTRPSPALLEARMAVGGQSPTIARDSGRPFASDEQGVDRSLEAATMPVPLVGRDKELRELDAAVALATRGETAPPLLILGEPGIGKSRLLEEIAVRIQRRQGLVLRGRSFEAEMVRPYGPFIDALRGVPPGNMPGALAGTLSALLPELGGSGATDRNSLFDAVLQLLRHLTRDKRPLALLLDDAQWFDASSVALLHYLARAERAGHLLIACAARPAELVDNRSAWRLVSSLRQSGRASPVQLEPLDPDAIAALADALACKVDVGRVVRESSGNPLLAVELTRALARGDSAESGVLSDLIAERLERLSEPAQQLVAWAAALGKSFELEMLQRVTGKSTHDVVQVVAELERHAVVRVAADATSYDFVHDLVRNGAYLRLSHPSRRAVHRSIARTLDTAGVGADILAAEIAHHAALAGDAELAVQSALTAARRCLKMFARAEAARLAQAGLDQLGAMSAAFSTEQRISSELALLTVQVYSGVLAGRSSRLKRELVRSVGEAEQAGLHAQAVDGLRALSVLEFEQGQSSAARESTLRAAERARTVAPIERAKQLAETARCLAMLEQDMERAQALYLEACELCTRAHAQVPAVEWARGLLCAYAGDRDQAREALGIALECIRATEDRWAEYECLRHIVELELEANEMENAEARGQELLEVARKMPEGSEIAVANALLAICRLSRGEPQAPAALDRALQALRDLDAQAMLGYTLNFAAICELKAKRLELAESRAREALRASELVNRETQVVLAKTLLARIALARGDAEAAREALAAEIADPKRSLTLSARARRELNGALALLNGAAYSSL